MKKRLIALTVALCGFATTAHALTYGDVAKWPQPMRNTFDAVVDMGDNEIVASKGSFMLIKAYGGDACDAGQYFLANKELKTVEQVDIGTCDSSDLQFKGHDSKVKTASGSIDVLSHGELVARFPVY